MNKFYSIISLLAAATIGMTSQAAGVYQIPNGNGEISWSADNEPGNGLHSFGIATIGGTSSLLNTGKKNAQDLCYKATGRNSSTAIAIKSKSIIVAKANGNLTTGNIIMGSTTASDKANHNETRRSMGADGSLEFLGLPDTLEFYSKYKKGETKDYNGNVNAFIHGDVDYADPAPDGYPTKADYVVAFLESPITPSEDWKRNALAFEYYTPAKVDMAKDTRYLLMNMTTNPTPGGSAKDELIVDDIHFIYNSKIDSLNYDDVVLIDGDKDNYKLTVNAEYDESKLFYRLDGRGATSETSFDSESGVLTITVKGNDITVDENNFHTYKIEFKQTVEEVKPILVSAMEFMEWLVVKTESAIAPIKKTLTVELYDNLKANLKLDDVKADSVAYSKDGDITLIKGTSPDGVVVDLITGVDTAYGTIVVEDITYEYGKYVPSTVVSYSDSMFAIVNGVVSETELKAIEATYSKNGSVVLTINDLKIGSFDLGNVKISNLKYETDNDSVIISGKSDVKTSIGLIPMSVTKAKADSSFNGLKMILAVDLSTLGYVAELKYGYPTETNSQEEVVKPVLIKKVVYSDRLKSGEDVVKANIEVSYYSDGNSFFLIDGKEKIDSVSYKRDVDSIRFEATKGIVYGASTSDYSKLKMEFADGRIFGFAPDTVKNMNYGLTMLTYSDDKYGVTKSKIINVVYLSDSTAILTIEQLRRVIGNETSQVGDLRIPGMKWRVEGDTIRLSGNVSGELKSGSGVQIIPVTIHDSYTDSQFSHPVIKMTCDLTNTYIGEPMEIVYGLPEPLKTLKSVVFNDSLVVKSNGEIVSESHEDLKIEYFDNGYATLSLFNFAVDENIVVGDIVVDSIPYTVDDTVRMHGTRNVTIAPKVGTIGSSLGVLPVEVEMADCDLEYMKMNAVIRLDLIELGEKIEVVFGANKPVVVVPTIVMSAKYKDVLNTNGALREVVANVDYYSNKSIVANIAGMTLTGLYYSLDDSLKASGKAVIKMDGVDVDVNVSRFATDRELSKLYMDVEAETYVYRFGYDTIPVPEVPLDTVKPDTTPVIPGDNDSTPKLLRTVVYNDDLVINISGDDMLPQTQDITIDYYDNGTATLSIMNFVMGEGEDGMLVGDIVLNDVPYVQTDSVRMSILKNIFITSSDPNAMGNSLPEIPVEIKSATSSNNFDKLKAVIGIDLEDMYVTVYFGNSDKTNTGVVKENESTDNKPSKSSILDNMVVSVNGESFGIREGNTRFAYNDDKLTLTLVGLAVDLGDGDITVGDIQIELPTTKSDMIYFEGEDTVKIITHDVYEIGNQTEYARVKVSNGKIKPRLTKAFYDMDIELIDLGITFTVNFGDSTTAVINILSESDRVEDTRVFTIMGTYVSENIEDMNSLPAGIYIRDRKKYIIRK